MNNNDRDGMRYPSIDQLVEKTNSKYKLVVGAAKRAKELQYNSENEKPLIDNYHSKKNLGIALEEIVEGKLKVVDASEE